MDRQNCLRMINEIAEIHEEYDDLRNKALYSKMSLREITDAILEITENEARALRRVSDKCGASCTLGSIQKPAPVLAPQNTTVCVTQNTDACKADAMTGRCVVPLSGDPIVVQILANAAEFRGTDGTGMRWA